MLLFHISYFLKSRNRISSSVVVVTIVSLMIIIIIMAVMIIKTRKLYNMIIITMVIIYLLAWKHPNKKKLWRLSQTICAIVLHSRTQPQAQYEITLPNNVDDELRIRDTVTIRMIWTLPLFSPKPPLPVFTTSLPLFLPFSCLFLSLFSLFPFASPPPLLSSLHIYFLLFSYFFSSLSPSLLLHSSALPLFISSSLPPFASSYFPLSWQLHT